MARLVQGHAVAQRSAGEHANEPVIWAASSERMSPNMFSVTTTSKSAGRLMSCMAVLSTSKVLQLDIGVVGVVVDAVHDLTPQAARLQHVGLVDARHLAAALAGRFRTPGARCAPPRTRVFQRVVGALAGTVYAGGRLVVEALAAPKYNPPVSSRTIIMSTPSTISGRRVEASARR